MSETTETRVRPEAVGQERPTPEQNKSGVGGYMRLHGFMWILVILTALVFVAAILFAAR